MQMEQFFRSIEFLDWGLRGLYNGETAQAIARRKGVTVWQAIFDWMNREELAANMARTLLVQHLLHTRQVADLTEACHLHFEVGASIRQAILDAGNTPPEDQPTPAFCQLSIDWTTLGWQHN